MSEHPIQPTQVVEPGRTTVRTAIQTAIGIVLAAGLVIPAAIAIIGDEFAAWTSPEVVRVLGVVSAVAIATSSALARIMAHPAVNAWLARVGLGAGAGTVVGPLPVAEATPVQPAERSPWEPPEPTPARARDDDGDGKPDVTP